MADPEYLPVTQAPTSPTFPTFTRPESETESIRRQSIEAGRLTTFGDGLKAAYRSDGLFQLGYRLVDLGYPDDPDYQMTASDLDGWMQDVDERYLEMFAAVRSKQHGNYISQWMKQRTEQDRQMAERPGAAILGGIASPTNIVLGIASAGVGASVVAARSAGILATTRQAAIASGLGNAALFGGERALAASYDPTVRFTDVAAAGLGGAAFGATERALASSGLLQRSLLSGVATAGAEGLARLPEAGDDPRAYMMRLGAQFVAGSVGGLFNGEPYPGVPGAIAKMDAEMAQAVGRVSRDIYDDIVGEVGAGPDGPPNVPRGTLSPAFKRRIDDEAVLWDSANTEVVPTPTQPAMTMGAATEASIHWSADPNPAEMADRMDFSFVGQAPSAGFKIAGPITRVGKTGSSEMDNVITAIARDDTALRDGVSGLGADQAVATRMRARENIIENTLARHHAAHRQNAKAAGKAPQSIMDFAESVTLAKRRLDQPDLLKSLDPAAVEAARDFAAIYADDLMYAQGHNVPNADIDNTPNYANRITLRQKKDALIARPEVGPDGLANTIKPLIRNVDDPLIRQIIADAWVTLAGTHPLGDITLRQALSAGDMTNLRALLRGEMGGERIMQDGAIEKIVKAITGLHNARRAPDSGAGTPRLKHRIDFDETARVPLLDAYGKQIGTETFGLEDVLDNNIVSLSTSYARSMTGAAAVAEIGRVMRTGRFRGEVAEAGKSPATVAEILDEIAKSLGGAKIENHADYKMVRQLLEYTAYGRLGGDGNAITDAADALRSVAHVRLMSGLGTAIANTTEIADTLSRHGWAVVQQLPDLPAMLKEAATGKASSSVLQDLNTIGLGFHDTNIEFARPRARPFEAGSIRDRLGAVNHALSRGRMYTGIISGTTYIQRLTENLATRAITQRLYNWAKSNKTPSAIKLRQMGINPDEWASLSEQLRAHVTTGPMGVVQRLNPEKWDTGVLARLRTGIAKESQALAYTPSATQMNLWFSTSPFGRVVSQLRRYNLGAWNSKVERWSQAIAHGDASSTLLFVGSGIGASAAYAVRTYYESAGRSDAKDYRKERLTTRNMILAGFGRASWSSMLPSAVDTALQAGQHDPIFANFRTTGPSSLIDFDAVPVVGQINQTVRAAGAAYRSALGVFRNDDVLTQADFNALVRGLGIPNALKLHDGLKRIVGYDSLPTTEYKR